MGRKSCASSANKVEKQIESKDLSAKKELSTVIRRSGRIRNQVRLSQNKEFEPVVTMNLAEDEAAYEPDDVEYEPDDVAYEPTDMEIAVHSERSLEEKVDYIFKAVEELKSKVPRPQVDVPVNELNYKSLYISSQKRVEALKEENYELSKKAEVAIGKMEGYAEATRVWSEVLGQVKEVLKSSKATRKHKKLVSPTNASSAPSEAADVANGGVETQPRAKKQKKAKLSGGN